MNDRIDVTIEAIIHATEDVTKFYRSFKDMLGVGQEQFATSELAGHYDNPITVIAAKITGEESKRVIDMIASGISEEEKKEVIDQILPKEDSSMHIRLDRQSFVGGHMVLGQESTIKLKISPRVIRKEKIFELYQSLLRVS